jgi:hypothetical protein
MKRHSIMLHAQQTEATKLDAATRLRRTLRQLSPSGKLCSIPLHN